MELIQIKKYGYGIDGKTLDLTIAIPKNSYLKAFYVANQNDIYPDNSTRVGIDYINAIKATNKLMTIEQAFKKLFEYVGDYVNKEDGNTYDIYRIKSDAEWITPSKVGIGVKISQNDLTYITMELSPIPYGFNYSSLCGEDSTIAIFPMYNLLALRLKALSAAKFIGCSCDIPLDFIDKILQIKAIELANCSGNYYKASTYWNKFYKGKNIVTNKRCGCHG